MQRRKARPRVKWLAVQASHIPLHYSSLCLLAACSCKHQLNVQDATLGCEILELKETEQ